MASHTIAKLGGQRHRGSGDIMVLVRRVISQDHVIQGSYEFMGGTPHVKSTPSKFGGHRHCGSGDMFSVCHVILQYQVTKE